VDRAVRIAGIRETFEETSLLLAERPDGSAVAQPLVTDASFLEVVRASGGRLALGDIHPYSHWITPEAFPRRFDTWFLLARAPAGQVPKPDGAELVDLEWVAPADLLARAEGGEPIMFPTLMNVSRLVESGNSASAIEAARTRSTFTVLPWVEERADGSRVVRLPPDAGYPRTEFPAPAGP
jgi:8-oxo-dGTP pyrophosphatase MutT (NUDIX family)